MSATWQKSTHSGAENTDCVEVFGGTLEEIQQA